MHKSNKSGDLCVGILHLVKKSLGMDLDFIYYVLHSYITDLLSLLRYKSIIKQSIGASHKTTSPFLTQNTEHIGYKTCLYPGIVSAQKHNTMNVMK